MIVGVLMVFGGIAGLVAPGLHPPQDPTGIIPATLFLGLILVALAGLGVYLVLSALRFRLVLTADSVELREAFGSRRLSAAEIQGRRVLRNPRGPRSLVLIPRQSAGKKLKISLILKTDRAFDAWIARIPDLDEQEVHQSEQEVANTRYQDLMPQERAERIKRLKASAKWLNWIAIGLSFGALILPDYHHLLIGVVILLPWIAIGLVARFQPLYRFGGRRNDAHPDLTAALIFPGAMLMARALAEAHVLGWSGPLMLALAGGIPLTAAAIRVDPWFRQQIGTAIILGALTLLYGFGVGFEINIWADSVKPITYATQVLGKRVTHGRSTSYYLTVAPWGPVTRDDEISVSADRYDTTAIGATLCVYLGKGAFKVPWYQLRDCPVTRSGAAQAGHT